jgi:hypothetical protein
MRRGIGITQGDLLMRFLIRLLPILLICVTTTVSAAQEDIDYLLRRLLEIEAEQERSKETIKTLRSEIETLRSETKTLRSGAEKTQSKEQSRQVSTPELKYAPVFPELANESQFVLRSHDGDFSLKLDGTIIGRYELNRRRDDGSGSSNTDMGFEMTGTRINFRGELYGDVGYWVRFNADDFGDPIIDAVMAYYHLSEDMTVVFGQFPSLLNREQGIPADKLQVVESSPTNYAFDPFGYKGLMLGYHTPRMVYRAIINDGYRSTNNAYFEQPSAKWAFAGQVSGLAVGDKNDWERFNNFTSRPGNDFAWLLNAAFHVQEGDSHDSVTDSSRDMFLGMLESSMEGDGWNIYTSAYYRITDLEVDDIDAVDLGFVLLAGAWVAKKVELYSRFDITIPDSDRLTEDEEFKTLTAGANYYPFPHTDNIKLFAETQYMFDSEADSIVEPNIFTSVRDSPAGDQIIFRTGLSLRW